MINFMKAKPKTSNISFNPFAPKKRVDKNVEAVLTLSKSMPSNDYKALTSQILELERLDKENPVGKKLNIAA